MLALTLHARARYQVPDNIFIVFLYLTADHVQHDHVETSTGRRRKARGVQGRKRIHFGMNTAKLHFVSIVSRLIRTRVPGAKYGLDVTCVCTLSNVFELNRHKQSGAKQITLFQIVTLATSNLNDATDTRAIT